jgi:hypothetical protein
VAAAPGAREVCVYAINVLQGSVNPLLGCRTVDVGVLPIGRIEAVTAHAFEARVVGWALDADTTAPIDVHIYADGRFVKAVTASGSRPDVAAVYPASGATHASTRLCPCPRAGIPSARSASTCWAPRGIRCCPVPT